MDKLDISIAVPGLPFDGRSATEQSLGGSESAGYYMARELARLGHHVRLFCNCDTAGLKPGVYDGVQYFPMADWQEFARCVPHDLAIVQRVPQMLATPLRARLNWLWCHDMALGRQRSDVLGVMWNVDSVLVLSEYMREQYRTVYGLPESALLSTRNGIDLNAFGGLGNVRRHRKRLVYAARPERGLDNLLERVMPRLLAADPEIELHLAGYQNAVQHLAPFYAQIDRNINALGPRVKWHGALSKRQLYELYASCGAYVYPTPSKINEAFNEISCISAMEAQACGVPLVASRRGALPETAGDAARYVDGAPWTDAYTDAFVASVLDLVQHEAEHAAMVDKARANAQQYGWAGVAEQWTAEAAKQLAAACADPDRLATHLWKHSDIMAARELIKRNPGRVDERLAARIERDFSFADSPEAYREQYERIGLTHGPNIGHEVGEPRFQLLENFLRQHPECDRVVDYGCAYGNYLLNLVPRLPERRWVGLDVDKHSIALAKKHATEKYKLALGERLQLLTLQEEEEKTGGGHLLFGPPGLPPSQKANCLILFEVLEHVPDPVALAEAVEQYVEPGGRVLITVPYGPWEYDSYETYPHRCHLWEYDWHDLRDLFGAKKDVQIAPVFYGYSQRLQEALGWWLVEYVVEPGRPTGAIDMERKLRVQRPAETVSATLIAGPNSEENLHWCLNSLHDLADETVLVDTGMSPEARRIAETHAVALNMRIVSGPDPKVEGFETPRNVGLAECRKDWVFWCDTDEKLLGVEAVHKYLRSNSYNGYCLRQMHFACDTHFDPDTPVRLFRRLYEGEQRMRWYGMIHEHPELKMNEGPGMVVTLSDAWVPHVGYLSEAIRRRRFDRNLPLLMKDIERYPDRILQKHFIIRDKMLMVMHALQRTGGQVTPDMQVEAQEVIALYRQHFLGKAQFVGVNTLQYYSQACQVLNIGAEVAFQVAAAKTGTPQVNGAQYYRFASQEDFEAELLKAARGAVGQYMEAAW